MPIDINQMLFNIDVSKFGSLINNDNLIKFDHFSLYIYNVHKVHTNSYLQDFRITNYFMIVIFIDLIHFQRIQPYFLKLTTFF
jgi:hypothetical protein